MSMYSGAGIEVLHNVGETSRKIILGLQQLSGQYTIDGMPKGYTTVAIKHIVDYFDGILPDTINVSAQFPQFTSDDDGNIITSVDKPTVAIRAVSGFSKEIGIGGIIWDDSDGQVRGFNQVMYMEFHIYSKSVMKAEQIIDQVGLQLQLAKRGGGQLHSKGFQNFIIVSTDTMRGFRFDTAWDYRMQHQYARFFHSVITVKTSFDVVWRFMDDSDGVISMIVFNDYYNLDLDQVMGMSLAYLRLEQIYYGWHGHYT